MPKTVDHAERTRAIATAAIDVIAEAGLEGARLRDVAKAASVTTGAVTHYFDGKDAVLEAALSEVVRHILEGQRAVAESGIEGGDVALTVAAFLPNTEERRRDWKVWFAFWGRAISDPRLRRLHRDYYSDVVANLEQAIRGWRRTGLAHEGADPRVTADAIIAAVDGLGVRASLEPGDWTPERQLRTLRALIEPMLRSPTPQ